MRQKLIENHQKILEQKKVAAGGADVNPRYRDGRLPKNKDQRKFMDECQELSKTKNYLRQKLTIKSTHEQITCAKDLPNDHVYGMKVELDHDINNIMKNAYDL